MAGPRGALALACAFALVADVEAKARAGRRGGGYSIVNTGQGGDLDLAATIIILAFVGLAVIFCALGAWSGYGARRLTRYRTRHDASRALEELDLVPLEPGTKVTLRHNGVDIDGVGTVLRASEPHGDRVQIEWPPSTPSHFTYRPDGPRGPKMRVRRGAWWPRASVVPWRDPPEDAIECEAPAADTPDTPAHAPNLASIAPGPWLCEWRTDDARPAPWNPKSRDNSAAKVESFGLVLAVDDTGDGGEDGRTRLVSTQRDGGGDAGYPMDDDERLYLERLYQSAAAVTISWTSGRVVAAMSKTTDTKAKPSVFFTGRVLTKEARAGGVQWNAMIACEGSWRSLDGVGGWMRLRRVHGPWLETRALDLGFPRSNARRRLRAAVHAVRAHGFFAAVGAAASRERAAAAAAAAAGCGDGRVEEEEVSVSVEA